MRKSYLKIKPGKIHPEDIIVIKENFSSFGVEYKAFEDSNTLKMVEQSSGELIKRPIKLERGAAISIEHLGNVYIIESNAIFDHCMILKEEKEEENVEPNVKGRPIIRVSKEEFIRLIKEYVD